MSYTENPDFPETTPVLILVCSDHPPGSAAGTPRRYAFLPCGHVDFESAVTEQNDEFKAVFIVDVFTLV